MASNVTGLVLRVKLKDDNIPQYRNGKLFLGVLGVEYSIPYFSYLNGQQHDFDLMALPNQHVPQPSSLYYSYMKRTSNPEEFSYSDGSFITYLRFQPDLAQALNDAANNDILSGNKYMSQYVDIEQPTLLIRGQIAVYNPDGSISYQDKTSELVIPVNPPSSRKIRLSPETGLIIILAQVR